jgi:glycosyltransferase involved in cell wall biosynthesis|tara:strand:- start:499 stop:1605 length:1107 start_codon:yes stop_codon:yes gene_type:complete
MVFHVLSIPVHPTRKEITLCAFTQKVYKFCKIMTARGHTVFHYGHPDSKVNCTQHFNVISRATYDEVYQQKSWKEFLPQKVFNKAHEEFNKNAAALIKKNKQSDEDFVLAFWGFGHAACCNELKDDYIIVEPSIGYNSGFAPFKVFETYAQLHTLHHQIYEKTTGPSFTDHVIRPGFYLEDFEYKENKENYLLFLGRMVDVKGIQIAQDLSKASSTPIKFVGPHNLKNKLKKNNPLAEYIPTVSHEERKKLLSNAKALVMPTLYIEPCGWSMIEAFISGTPVLSTDWGGFSEYNIHGQTGFRCRSLNEFYHALESINFIKPQFCRKYAEENFTIELVAAMYETYFEHLIQVRKYGLGTVFNKCKFLVK